jgi:hypothetical protein
MFIGALTLAATLGTPAFADEFSGFNIGAGVSQDTFESNVAYVGTNVYFDDVDTTRFGYYVHGGWALNKYFGAEIGYRSGGDFNQLLFSNGLYTTSYARIHNEVKGFEASVTGAWWFSKKVALFGRAGLYAWKGEVTFSENPDTTLPTAQQMVFTERFEDDGMEPVLGIGLQSTLDGALVRLEYRMNEFDDFGSSTTTPQMLESKQNSLQLSIVWTLH